MKKIDIHCHTTNRPLPFAAEPDATLEHISARMHEHDIAHTILLATYFPHRESGVSNFRIAHWIAQYAQQHAPNPATTNQFTAQDALPPFIFFGSLDFEHFYNQGLSELEELAKSKLLSGIKIYTTYQNIDLAGERMHEVMNLAQSHALPVTFHTGLSYMSMRTQNTPTITRMVMASDLQALAHQYPTTPIIASHMAKPYFDDLISTAKQTPNLLTDMSGLIDSIHDRADISEDIETIARYVGECGPHKLLFGTDFPVQTHADSVNFIEEALKQHSSQDRAQVYFGNAYRILTHTHQ